MSQPNWAATIWTVQLVIPAAGRSGSYNVPSLGCSGTLTLPATATTRMAAVAITTSTVKTGCVARARLTLTLSGGGISLTWVPAGHPLKLGTAQLTQS